MLERPYASNHLPDKPGSDQVAFTSPGKSTGDAALYLGSRCLAQTLTPPPPTHQNNDDDDDDNEREKYNIYDIMRIAWHPKDQLWGKMVRKHRNNYLYGSQNPLLIGFYWPGIMPVWFKLSTTEL